MSRKDIFHLAVMTSVILFFFHSLDNVILIFSLSVSDIIEGEASWQSILFVVLVIIACLLPIFLASKLQKKDLRTLAISIAVITIVLRIQFIVYDGWLLWAMLILETLEFWIYLILFTLGILYIAGSFRHMGNLSFPSFVLALSLYNVLSISEDMLFGLFSIGMTPLDIFYIIWSILIIAGLMRLQYPDFGQDSERGIGLWGGLAIGGFLYLQVVSGISLSTISIMWSGEILLLLLIIAIALVMILARKQILAWMISTGWSRLFCSIVLIAGILIFFFASLSAIGETALLISYFASFLVLLVFFEMDTDIQHEVGPSVTLSIAFALALYTLDYLILVLLRYLPHEILNYTWFTYVLAGLVMGVGTLKIKVRHEIEQPGISTPAD